VELKQSGDGRLEGERGRVKGQNSERGIETAKMKLTPGRMAPSVKGQNSERGIETWPWQPNSRPACQVSKARIPSVELKQPLFSAADGLALWCQRPEFRAWN